MPARAIRYKAKLMRDLTNSELEEFGQKMLKQALHAKAGVVTLHPRFRQVAEAGVAEEMRRSQNAKPSTIVTINQCYSVGE